MTTAPHPPDNKTYEVFYFDIDHGFVQIIDHNHCPHCECTTHRKDKKCDYHIMEKETKQDKIDVSRRINSIKLFGRMLYNKPLCEKCTENNPEIITPSTHIGVYCSAGKDILKSLCSECFSKYSDHRYITCRELTKEEVKILESRAAIVPLNYEDD